MATATLTVPSAPYGPRDIPHLATAFLALTGRHPETRIFWRRERNQARQLLRQCRRRGYFRTVDALFDLDWITDILGDVVSQPVEDAPSAADLDLAELLEARTW